MIEEALRKAAFFILGLVALGILAFALILARAAKKADKNLDAGLDLGTEHENGTRPRRDDP